MKQSRNRITPQRSAAPSKSGKLEGTLRLHPRGFGFVESDDPADTVFVPPAQINGVLDGDTVVANWRAGATGERNTTKIVVTGRARQVVVGTVSKPGYIELDPGVGSGIVRCDGAEGTGTVVVALLTSTTGNDITTIFDHSLGSPEVALTARIMNRHLFPETHTAQVESEASRVASASPLRPSRKALPDQRRDLTGQHVVTIDADHSRDLDDALAAMVDDDGHLRVWVHIADVAQYVKPGSALDVSAQQVPTSVYLPDHVRPMLPATLSEQALSLLPGVLRDVLTVEMRIAPQGTITSVDVYEARIRSKRRLSYDTVAGVIDGTLGLGDNARGVNDAEIDKNTIDVIMMLHAAASRIGFVRKSRGGVDGNRVSIELPFAEGDKSAIAHLLVERLMVAANESVATWLVERGAPALFRVHPALTDEQTGELEVIARAVGVSAYLPRPLTPAAFTAFTEQLEGTANSATVWDAIMGMMGRAGYSPENSGHFGLGSTGYLHFTSPLRRYADLVIHRIVKQYLEGLRSGEHREWGVPNLQELSQHIDRTNRRADAAEREAGKAIELATLKTGQQTEGVVVSISSRGVVVATPLSSIAALVPARKLPKGWVLDESIRRVRPQSGPLIAVGDRVKIKTERIEPLTGRFEAKFSTSGTNSSAPRNTSKPSSPSSTGSKKKEHGRGTNATREKRTGRNSSRVVEAVSAVGNEEAPAIDQLTKPAKVSQQQENTSRRSRNRRPAHTSANPTVDGSTPRRQRGKASSGERNERALAASSKPGPDAPVVKSGSGTAGESSSSTGRKRRANRPAEGNADRQRGRRSGRNDGRSSKSS